MNRGRFPLFTLLLFAALAPAGAVSPTVSNVRGLQQSPPSQFVDIYYTLADADSPTVRVALEVFYLVSSGGTTTEVPIPATALSGAGIGEAVAPGPDKHIRWNAGADWPGQQSQTVRFRVLATDDPPAPSVMVLIPAGSFQMGNSTNAAEGDTDELPVHTVHVSGFYMDRCEVTKQLWDEVRAWGSSGGRGYTDLPVGGGKAANHPVQTISWYAVVKWCNARSEKDNLTPVYYTNDAQTVIYKTGSVNVSNVQVKWGANGYRLPTEAEWEKAARGGLSAQRFPWGATITHAQANYRSHSSLAFDVSPTRGYHPTYAVGAFPYTSPIGSFAPNGYGLYDMAGNVWEWCWDWYGASYYSTSPSSDPQGPPPGSGRVIRGGRWDHIAYFTRVAYRGDNTPGITGDIVGFRSVRR